MPNHDRWFHEPNDNEQMAPITIVLMVTNSAALFLLRRNSSWKKAVLTSWSDISEVRAANDNSVKNSSDTTYPNTGMAANA